MNGKLIVLEGIDGSGKATQSGLLEDHLIKRGKDVMHISFLIMEVLLRRW